ncbi:MAG: ATP-binding protein [Prevotellaceae bacterium]|nr:ATP-binding protein [Prevotella sp.]MDD6802553.1 ATP-binding protein [Prevotellaceae bacterium]
MDYNVIIAILCTATIFCIVCLVLHRRYRRTIGKVTFLFNAIDNLDFSFNFPEQGRDKLINESLNRIRRILETARHEAIERERYYEQIINAVSTGIMVVDERGCVLQHNDAALRLLGVETLTFESQAAAKLASEDFSKRETTAMLHDKKVRIIAFSDIRNELSSREMESWTKLIRVLTHEIMNNVAPITSLSETLSHKANDNEIKEGLSVINSTGKQLLNFVDNYRRMTLIPKPQPKLFYVKPFLERMVAISKEYSKTSDIHQDISLPDLLLYADESLIAHVVTNILKNAVEAGASAITIAAYTAPDDSVCIDISNNGKPIPTDEAQQIFVPFFTTKPTGSGIGLSISRQIMKQSGGSIELITSSDSTTLFRLKFS